MIDKQKFPLKRQPVAFLERIFKQHYGAMYQQACRMLGNDAESRDVVSDVFAQLLDDSVCLREETLRNYLLTLTRNRCINLLVRRQRELSAVMVDVHQEDDTEQELLEALYRYIDKRLPPLTQQILRLRYQQGMKYREIAEELQVSEVTVHHHLSQSLKQMKDHFKAKGYGI